MPERHWTPRSIEQQTDLNRKLSSLIDNVGLPGLVHQLLPTLVRTTVEIKPGKSGRCQFLGHDLADLRLLDGEFAVMYNRASEAVIPKGAECMAERVAIGKGDGGWVLSRMICCTGSESGPTAPDFNCECVVGGSLCRIVLNIAEVKAHINNNDGITWPAAGPTSCTNQDSEYTLAQCGTCNSWNGMWPMTQQTGVDPDRCLYGVQNKGFDSESFAQLERLFPCSRVEEDGTVEATLSCHPTDQRDGTGALSLAITRDGCQLITMNFEKVEIAEFANVGPFPDRTNRVTQIAFDGSCFCTTTAPVTTRSDNNLGTWSPVTKTPDLRHGVGTACDNYTVNVSGSHDFGDGEEFMDNTDVLVYEPLYNRWMINTASQYAPCEFGQDSGGNRHRFIDHTGCDWTETLHDGLVWLTFEFC